jgi:hypothetical protein
MTLNQLALVGLVVWGIVFVLLVAGLAIVADIERRWTAEWARDWEKRNGTSVDVLLERLTNQTAQWQTARKLLNLYVWLGLIALVVLGFFQYRRWILDPVAFRSAMLFGLALVGLFFLPVRVICEVGLGVLDAMYRQIRVAADDQLVIRSAAEISEIPSLRQERKEQDKKEKEKNTKAEDAPPLPPPPAAKQAPGPAPKK